MSPTSKVRAEGEGMHDPMTVAFEIKYPWKSRPSEFYPNGYRGTFITIWHRDPESGETVRV